MDVIQWLLNHGADVNALSSQPWAPIDMAVSWGHLQAVRMLIEYKADINVSIEFGEVPLHVAARRGDNSDQVGILQLLLDHGANPNARDDDGSTPLHYCSSWQKGDWAPSRGSVEGTHLLLKYGANMDAEDNEGRTPLQFALEHDCQDIAACLKEHGATL
jgi:ankyrin repeat protein